MPDSYPIAFLGGRFLEITKASVSVLDRGFLYGDGLFESVRICRGKLFRWREHLERILSGAAFLKLRLGCSGEDLTRAALDLVEKNEASEAILRINISRGIGERGYSIRHAGKPTILITLHQAPVLNEKKLERWKFQIAHSVRLPSNNVLAAYKTLLTGKPSDELMGGSRSGS